MTLEEKQLREEIFELTEQMAAITDKATGRDLTKKEAAVHDRLYKQARQKKKELHNILMDQPTGQANLNSLMAGGATFSGGKLVPGVSPADKDVQVWESIDGPSKGRQIRVIPNNRSLTKELNIQKGPEELNWRDYMRDRIQGYTGSRSMEYKNEMSTTSDASLVPEVLSSQVIDLARNKSRIFQAGAMTVPMSSKTLTIARVTGDASTEWKAENAIHTPSDVTTEGLVFTAKTLIASVKMSVELSEDAPNASSVIENSLSNSLALELDRVALVGSGTDPEPQGVFGATSVQTVDLGANGAALTDYDPFSDAYQKELEANAVPGAVIFAPRTWGTLDKLKDTTNQPLQPPMSFARLLALQTNQIPINLTKGTSGDASIAILGDYSQLLVGVRTQLRIEITRVGAHSDGAGAWDSSAWEKLQVWVRAYLRADIQLAHPDHFTVIDGIIP